MPKRKTHEHISRILLGKSFPNVDKVLDWPVRFMGKNHRKVLHSIPEGFIVGLVLTGDVKGAVSGIIHVAVDALDSVAKKEIKNLTQNRGDEKCLKKGKKEKRKKKRSF